MLGGSSGFGKRPVALVCYICGREFGTSSLAIHQKQCAKKWEVEESKKPLRERRPLPEPPSTPSTTKDFEKFNEEAFNTYNSKALIPCPNCARTFLPDRLEVHLRSCKPGTKMRVPASPNAATAPSPQLQQMVAAAKRPSSASASRPSSSHNTSTSPNSNGANPNHRRLFRPDSASSSSVNHSIASYEHDDDLDHDLDEAEHSWSSKAPVQQPVRQSVRSLAAKPSGSQHRPESGARPSSGRPFSHHTAAQQEDDRVPCRVCGRKFNTERIEKHENACHIASRKRKAFNSAEARMTDEMQEAPTKKSSRNPPPQKEKPIKAAGKTSKWKSEHQAFIDSIRYARRVKAVEESGGDVRTVAQPASMSQANNDYVSCPYCSRRYAPDVAQRHIPKCKNIINKPKPPPRKAPPMADLRPQSSTSTASTAPSSRTPSASYSRGPATEVRREIVPEPTLSSHKASSLPVRAMNQLPKRSAASPSSSDYEELPPSSYRSSSSRTTTSSSMSSAMSPSAAMGSSVRNPSPGRLSAMERSSSFSQVECPHCERKFEKRAAERHIPICQGVIHKPKDSPAKAKREPTPTRRSTNGPPLPSLDRHEPRGGPAAFCILCGTKFPSSAKYCGECGGKRT